jgi:hypothetical protein
MTVWTGVGTEVLRGKSAETDSWEKAGQLGQDNLRIQDTMAGQLGQTTKTGQPRKEKHGRTVMQGSIFWSENNVVWGRVSLPRYPSPSI